MSGFHCRATRVRHFAFHRNVPFCQFRIWMLNLAENSLSPFRQLALRNSHLSGIISLSHCLPARGEESSTPTSRRGVQSRQHPRRTERCEGDAGPVSRCFAAEASAAALLPRMVSVSRPACAASGTLPAHGRKLPNTGLGPGSALQVHIPVRPLDSNGASFPKPHGNVVLRVLDVTVHEDNLGMHVKGTPVVENA